MDRNHSYYNSNKTESYAARSFISGIVACLCIAVYLGSMVFAGIQVYTGIKERRAAASREFSSLAELSSAIGIGGFTDSFKDTITSEITKSRTLQGVIITGSLGDYAFERDRGKIIIWKDDIPDFKDQFGLSKVSLAKSVVIDNQTVRLRAVYSYIDYTSLIGILKRTLLLVVATLCLALFTLIFQFLLINPLRSPEDDRSSKKKRESFRQDKKDKKREPEDIFDLEEDKPEPVEEAKTGSESRFSISPEAFTQNRLTTELKRCISFKQDLVFMIIGFKKPGDIPGKDKELQVLADEAVKYFFRRDLIFEQGEQGIAVIIPSIDLDQGFTKSETFHERITAKYAEVFNSGVEFFMGLSSRADRAIDAEQLIFEASGALEKAREDSSAPIVAFRSDPEKYKAFIAAQNKHRS